MCSLDNFDRLFSGSVSHTPEEQGIADPSDISSGGGKGNRALIRIEKTMAPAALFVSGIRQTFYEFRSKNVF